MSDKDDVRFNVKMPEQLREDAKRNAERGELSEEVRKLFKRKAYGGSAVGETTELEKAKAELREVRDRKDELRRKRGRLENELEAQEARETRLEERIRRLEEERDKLTSHVEMLENMLQNGERMWPTRIKNAAGVDTGTAEELYQQLKDQNPELPTAAFEEPGLHDEPNWKQDKST